MRSPRKGARPHVRWRDDGFKPRLSEREIRNLLDIDITPGLTD
jgi:hypothetical protein